MSWNRGAWPLLVTLLLGCAADEAGLAPPTQALYYPVGIAAHPDGRYLYVVNGVFDRKYRRGTLVVYDTWERRILPGPTREIPVFGGELVVARRRADETVRAFTVTRDPPELLSFVVDAAAGDSPEHLGAPRILNRFQGGRRFQGDPYGLAYDGEALLVSHGERGVISRWTHDEAGDLRFQCSLNLAGGATSVARHPGLGWGYVSDRFGQRIQVVNPVGTGGDNLAGVDAAAECRLEPRSDIVVDPFTTRGRTRGLAFSADGSRLYVASSTDGSLRIYDTSVRGDGQARNRLIAALPVGNAPNIVRVAGLLPGESRPRDGVDRGLTGRILDEKGEGLVYVTAFEDDRVIVVDPRTLSVRASIDVPKGPHDIAFLPDPDGHLLGYVTHFSEHALSIIDLEPGSPRRFELLATVP